MPLFGKSKEVKEIEREVKFKQGLARVRSYIDRSKQTRQRMWSLGKRSLQLGDRRQFEQTARALLRIDHITNRWERYLIAAETVEVQRGQVKATKEFVGSINAVSESMMSGAKPEEIIKMQADLEKALHKAQTADETLAAVMDATSDSVFSGEGVSEDAVKDIESSMLAEAAQGGASSPQDERIAQGIRKIEEEMKRESK